MAGTIRKAIGKSTGAVIGGTVTATALGFPVKDFFDGNTFTQALTALSFSATNALELKLGSLVGGLVGWRVPDDIDSYKNSASSKVLTICNRFIRNALAIPLAITGGLSAAYLAASSLAKNNLAEFNQRAVNKLYDFSSGFNVENLVDGTEKLLGETSNIALNGITNAAQVSQNSVNVQDFVFQAAATPSIQATVGLGLAFIGGIIATAKVVDSGYDKVLGLFSNKKNDPALTA